MSCYQKAIEINPRIVGAHNNLGLIYRALNDLKSATKYFGQTHSKRKNITAKCQEIKAAEPVVSLEEIATWRFETGSDYRKARSVAAPGY